MKRLNAHPYADCFPMLSDAQTLSLADDIKENGQAHPVIVDQKNRIVDGRNRYRACELAGVEPLIERRELTDKQALRLVASLNLHRREMTPQQRALAGAELAKFEHGSNQFEKKVEASREASTVTPVSEREAAETVGCSRASIQRAKKIVASGSPKLLQAVRDSEIGLKQAEELTQLSRREQDEIVDRMHEPKTEKASPSPKKKRKASVDTSGLSPFRRDVKRLLALGKCTESTFWKSVEMLECWNATAQSRKNRATFRTIVDEMPHLELVQHDDGKMELVSIADADLLAAIYQEAKCLRDAFKNNMAFEPAVVRAKAKRIIELLSPYISK